MKEELSQSDVNTLLLKSVLRIEANVHVLNDVLAQLYASHANKDKDEVYHSIVQQIQDQHALISQRMIEQIDQDEKHP